MSQNNPSFTAPRSSSTSDRPKIPVGLQKGRCVSVIDYGTQTVEWNGNKKEQRQIFIGFEFYELLHTFDEQKGPQPLVDGRKFTWSFYKDSQMKRFINGWRGKALTQAEEEVFDVSKMLNALAYLTIEEKASATGKVYHNITNATLITKQQAGDVPPAHNELRLYHIDMGFECEAFTKLYEWQQKIIKESAEYQAYLAMKANQTQSTVQQQAQAARESLQGSPLNQTPPTAAAVPKVPLPNDGYTAVIDDEDDLPF